MRPTGADPYDVAVIGAGPTGLYAAFYAGMRNLRTLVLEALPRPGGQITALYPEKYIYDVGGYPAILGRDLVAELFKQAGQFGADFRFNERVESLEVLEPGRLRLTTTEGVYFSRTAIVCAGLGAFEPNRLAVPGVAELEGQGVHYAVRRREDFLGRRLLIVGGGDTAVDWALELHRWAREVTLIHRFDYFEAHARSVQALFESPVRVLVRHELRAVRGDGRVREAVIVDHAAGVEKVLAVDDVLICIGLKPNLGPIQHWGLLLDGRHVLVNSRQETNLPGLYAAGDIAFQEGVEKMYLIACGFAQAALAVGYAARFICPKARVFHGHSSQRKGMRYAPTPRGEDRG
jgi:thioredoxin reductase